MTGSTAWASPNRAHVPAVDHLRAYLAVLIVVYHAWHILWFRLSFGRPFAPDPWPIVANPLFAALLEGHTAVAGFMVLSGFIFVYGTGADHVRYGGFLRNRLLRIYPMYLTALAFGIALNPGGESFLGILRYVLPLANSGPAQFGTPAAMAWAVAVELQFYLVFPFLFALLHRHGAGLLLRMALLAVLLRLLLVLGGHDVTALSYWTLPGRIEQFLFGMVAAHWLNAHPQAIRALRWQVAPALAAIIAGLALFHQAGGWPVVAWWRALVPTVEGALWAWFIMAYVAIGTAVPAWLSEALQRVGRLSFSLYLLHLLVIEAWAPRLPAVSGDPFLDALFAAVILVLPACLLLAALAYSTIEAPFLGLRRRYLDG